MAVSRELLLELFSINRCIESVTKHGRTVCLSGACSVAHGVIQDLIVPTALFATPYRARLGRWTAFTQLLRPPAVAHRHTNTRKRGNREQAQTKIQAGNGVLESEPTGGGWGN